MTDLVKDFSSGVKLIEVSGASHQRYSYTC